MKNMVNLYHPEFHQKLLLLTLTNITVNCIFAVLFCSLLYFDMASKQQNFKDETSKTEQTKQQILIKELQIAVDNQNWSRQYQNK
jgi:hypothetical protein